jgi:hypothetical protein
LCLRQEWNFVVSEIGLKFCCVWYRTEILFETGLKFCCVWDRTEILLCLRQDWNFVVSEIGLKFCCVWDRTEILHIIFMYFNVSTVGQWWRARCSISEHYTCASIMFVLVCHYQVTTFMFWKTSSTVSTAVGTVSVKWNNSSSKTLTQAVSQSLRLTQCRVLTWRPGRVALHPASRSRFATV